MAVFSQALRLCPGVPVLLVSGKERVPPPSFQDKTSWSWDRGSETRGSCQELL